MTRRFLRPPSHRIIVGASVFGLAMLMTLLNAVKPIHMDDTVYHTYVTQIAAHPADPYGREIHVSWMPPKVGMDVLVPVFLPYWWSWAYQIHGENLFLCKLWLLPFPLMLVGGTWYLARRFARGLEPAITVIVAFSPAILPSLNFMLDIPELALGVTALALFTRACDRRSFPLAIFAGLLAGVAINVKWTGLVIPGVLGMYALTHQRIKLGLVASFTAALVFIGWESIIAYHYGQSHFLTHAKRRQTGLGERFNVARALVAIMGGVAPPILLLGLVALRRVLSLKVVPLLILFGLILIGLGVEAQPIFLVIGFLVLINLGSISLALLRRKSSAIRWRGNADCWFLVLWLMLEVLGYFVLSPYSAVRRVVGIVVAATLLVGHLASRHCRSSSERRAVRWVAAGGVLLGLFYYGIDLHEARVDKLAAETAAHDALALLEPGQTAWYVGQWGFRHYAAQAGLQHIIVGRTELKRGDLLVVPASKLGVQPLEKLDPTLLEEVTALKFDDKLPYRTVPPFYAGKEPIQNQTGPRFVVHIYRVINTFTPLGLILPQFGPKDRPVGASFGRQEP